MHTENTHTHLKTLTNAHKTEADTLRGREAYTSTAQLSVWRMAGERWVHSLKGLISQPQLPPYAAMNGTRANSPSLTLSVFHWQNTLTLSCAHRHLLTGVRNVISAPRPPCHRWVLAVSSTPSQKHHNQWNHWQGEVDDRGQGWWGRVGEKQSEGKCRGGVRDGARRAEAGWKKGGKAYSRWISKKVHPSKQVVFLLISNSSPCFSIKLWLIWWQMIFISNIMCFSKLQHLNFITNEMIMKCLQSYLLIGLSASGRFTSLRDSRQWFPTSFDLHYSWPLTTGCRWLCAVSISTEEWCSSLGIMSFKSANTKHKVALMGLVCRYLLMTSYLTIWKV